MQVPIFETDPEVSRARRTERLRRMFPARAFLLVPEWNWRDYLSGSRRA